MANTPTTNIGLNKPAVGDTGWGVTTNATIDRLDLLLGKVATLAFGKTPLVVADFDGKVISITGELTANATMVLPVMDRPLFVMNNTTGAFTLAIKDNGSNTTITLVAGKLYLIWVKAATIVDMGALLQHNLFADVNTGDFRHLTAEQLAAVAYLNVAQSWTKTQIGTPQAVTSSSSHVALDLSLGNNITFTINESTTFDNPANLSNFIGMDFFIIITTAGSRTVAWGNQFHSPDGAAIPAISSSAGVINVACCKVLSSSYIVCNLIKFGN